MTVVEWLAKMAAVTRTIQNEGCPYSRATTVS